MSPSSVFTERIQLLLRDKLLPLLCVFLLVCGAFFSWRPAGPGQLHSHYNLMEQSYFLDHGLYASVSNKRFLEVNSKFRPMKAEGVESNMGDSHVINPQSSGVLPVSKQSSRQGKLEFR